MITKNDVLLCIDYFEGKFGSSYHPRIYVSTLESIYPYCKFDRWIVVENGIICSNERLVYFFPFSQITSFELSKVEVETKNDRDLILSCGPKWEPEE